MQDHMRTWTDASGGRVQGEGKTRTATPHGSWPRCCWPRWLGPGLLAAALLLGHVAPVVAAASLAITSVTEESALTPPQLTLTGEFGQRAVVVTLEGVVLRQLGKAPTVIVAALPPDWSPGTYRLEVRQAQGTGKDDKD